MFGRTLSSSTSSKSFPGLTRSARGGRLYEFRVLNRSKFDSKADPTIDVVLRSFLIHLESVFAHLFGSHLGPLRLPTRAKFGPKHVSKAFQCKKVFRPKPARESDGTKTVLKSTLFASEARLRFVSFWNFWGPFWAPFALQEAPRFPTETPRASWGPLGPPKT